MCTFCEKIYPEKDWEDIVFALGKYSGLMIERFITIDENGKYDLNVDPGDPYELGVFRNVKFCPYCGRNLAENAEQEPKIGYCRDCKWWKDSDGVYRRGMSFGIPVESQCPINRKVVYEGNGYCYMFEPQQESEGKDE